MGPKNVFAAVLGATLVAWSSMSMADQYRAGEFLGLDLSTAVLSPKPLGPSTQFAPVRIEARAERARPAAAARATPAKTQLRNEGTSRGALPARRWRAGVAIRSTPRRSIPGFRPGRASPAASATGSDCDRAGASARHEQIAGQHGEQGQRGDYPEYAGGDREQSVRIQPSL